MSPEIPMNPDAFTPRANPWRAALIDDRDPLRVQRNRIVRLVQDLHAGTFMWLSDLLDAGREAGLEALETVWQMTEELGLVAVVSVERSPRSGELPSARDVLVTPRGDLHERAAPEFSSRRAGKVHDRFRPARADLLAGRDVCILEIIALAWEAQGREHEHGGIGGGDGP